MTSKTDSPAKLGPSERLARKRAAARLRQQRCRARKRQAMLEQRRQQNEETRRSELVKEPKVQITAHSYGTPYPIDAADTWTGSSTDRKSVV